MRAGTLNLLVFIFVAGGLATYVWRALGVFAAQKLNPDGELLRWLSCVATAIVAALCVKLALAPPDILKDTLLATRLGAYAAGILVYYGLSNAPAGVAAAFATMVVSEVVVRPLLSLGPL